jgi:hypothetical protein
MLDRGESTLVVIFPPGFILYEYMECYICSGRLSYPLLYYLLIFNNIYITYINAYRLDDRVVRFDYVKDEHFGQEHDNMLEELGDLVEANKVKIN